MAGADDDNNNGGGGGGGATPPPPPWFSSSSSRSSPPPLPPQDSSTSSSIITILPTTTTTAAPLPLTPSPGVYLAWKDLRVSVRSSSSSSSWWDHHQHYHGGGADTRKPGLPADNPPPPAQQQQQILLQDVSGYAEPGSLLAIMGPSGSGKTTLLDTLAGRLSRNTSRSGQIWMNGKPQLRPPPGISAYVTQDDTLIGTLTVRECISYSARLRIGTKEAKRQGIVERAILEMGLDECADTPVGNWHLRGISGGEKRRLSIAIEILTRPTLLFLDEPTSGLDSASAFCVVRTLQKLAQDGGRTILTSIHQPSSEVFELFDNLFLLSGGQTIYFGDTNGAFELFASAGFPCPPLRNPSDHFLRAINADFDSTRNTVKAQSKLHKQVADPLSNTTLDTMSIINILTNTYKTSSASSLATFKVHEISQMGLAFTEVVRNRASVWSQIGILTRRSFTNMSRDMGYYWLRLFIYIIVSLCIGTIYYNVGTSYNSIMARASCMSFVSGFLTFMAIGGFPSFVEDMKVFSREHLNGHYGVLTFVLANSLSSFPFLFLISISSSAICYFMVQLHPGILHFVYFVLCLFAGMLVVESLMMALATVVPNYLMGIILGSGIQGVFLLVAGFFRLPSDIPKPFWKYPLYYISFHTYTLQGMYKNDFLGLTFDNKKSDALFIPKLSGEMVVADGFEVTPYRSQWLDLAILLSMALMYRLMFFAMIKLKEQQPSPFLWRCSQRWRHCRLPFLFKRFCLYAQVYDHKSPLKSFPKQ